MTFPLIHTWAVGEKLQSSQVNSITANLQNALDKTGDTISAGTITLSGSGAIFSTAAGSIQGSVAGAIQGTAAGAIKSTVAGTIQLAGGASDWPTCATPRGYTVKTSLFSNFAASGSTYTPIASVGLQSTAAGGGFYIDLAPYLHSGATLASVAASISVGSGYTSTPATYPKIEVFRTNVATQTTVSLSSGGPAVFTPTPANVTAWVASGATQAWSFTSNQNHTAIDRSVYQYYVAIGDANGGTGSPRIYWLDLSVTFSAIADMRFP